MTTSSSPPEKLRYQATKIVHVLRRVALKKSDTDPDITFGIVMDDKVVKITMSWVLIKSFDEFSMVEYIVKQMQGASDDS
jgi:hypothetical protein